MSKCLRVYFKDGRILVISGVTGSDGSGDILSVDTSDTSVLINMGEVLYCTITMEPDGTMIDEITVLH